MNNSKKIYEIMTELNIEGDVGFDENPIAFWERKFIELYEKMKVRKWKNVI